VVNSVHQIYRRTGAGWALLPGAATDIGVGADGSVWVVGTNAVAGGFGIWHWTGTTWAPVPGGAVAVAVDPSGRPWVVNSVHQIYRRTAAGWALLPGAATDIGVGADGSVWVVGINAVAGGFGIWHWTGTTWGLVPGGAVRIAVDRNGAPWIINSSHQIFSYVDATITIGPSGTNVVGDAHTFVVTVKANNGGEAGWQPVTGVFPTVTLSPVPGTVTDNCAVVGTDANGQCTVVIDSSVVGTVTANARATLTVGGVTLIRDTAANAGPSGSGPATETFASSAQPPFLTGVSADGRYLVDQNGQPFLLNGDSVWELASSLNAADQETYLADRHNNGFNTVLTDLVDSPGMMGGNNGGANYAGDLPFTGGNFATPNPAYWSRIDTFLQEAAANDITVFAIPVDAYANAVFGNMTNAQAQTFGAFLANRYPTASYPNIVWMFGNDWAADGSGLGNSWPSPSFYSSLMAGLQSNGTRLTTVEEGYNESLSTDGAFGRTVSVNAAYSYNPDYEAILNGRVAANEPVFLVEAAYENSVVDNDDTPLDLRMQIGWYMTSGATGGFYGNDSLWKFGAGWQNQLDTTEVAQRKILDGVFAGINWSALQPDTGSQLVTSGRGGEYPNANTTVGTNRYVTAAYTADGTLAVIYNPDSSQNSITISPAVLGLNPTITRIDPTNGAATNLGWTTNPAGGTNAGGDHDWLYIINASPRT
jgi:hypothetical protein